MLVLEADNLARCSAIAHGFFGRAGGVSDGVYASLNCGPGSGDAAANVIENRRRALARLAGDSQATLLTLYQVHGPNTVVVDAPWGIDVRPQADAMVTNRSGVALGILTADCAPVLLADDEAKIIGAAHAGWKGAKAGVITSVVEAMRSLGARPERISAAIGPLISQANYEVGPEFRESFVESDASTSRYFEASPRPAHWQFDLESYVAQKLEGAGVGNVERLSTCTYARERDFFSYRRTTHRGEPDYGRDISAILLLP